MSKRIVNNIFESMNCCDCVHSVNGWIIDPSMQVPRTYISIFNWANFIILFAAWKKSKLISAGPQLRLQDRGELYRCQTRDRLGPVSNESQNSISQYHMLEQNSIGGAGAGQSDREKLNLPRKNKKIKSSFFFYRNLFIDVLQSASAFWIWIYSTLISM